VDGSEPSIAAVRQGAALAQSIKDRDPRLTLLHVIDYAILAPAYAEGIAPLIAEGEEILTNGREILKYTGLTGMVADKLLTGHPAQVIAEEAEQGHYALILMGARGLSPLKQVILGSVSKDVLYRVSQSIVGIVYP
jgi:nucleotide-binding universal stress UspA family protein